MITAADVSAVVSYDPATGVFRRLISGGRKRAGDVAGYVKSDGYRLISVGGKWHYAHRLAWLVSTGSWPLDEIDHINGDRDDNRLENLRECTRSENMRNVERRGYHWLKKDKRWRVTIKVDGKKRHVGTFQSEADARTAYENAAKQFHSEFAAIERPAPAKQEAFL